ncbi:MAG: exopolyphosphatase [Planctomycetaceae bacterium]|nr:exopolyphosphatase [Planctomycetaceae bacterium]
MTSVAPNQPAPPEASAPRSVGVIDVGSTSLRMAIAEIDQHQGVRILETLSQSVNLGKDTFTRGRIRKTTIEECVRALKRYRSKLAEYQIVEDKNIRVVATSAVREANNRLAFLDRVYLATGLQIEAIDEAEVSRITYLGIQRFFWAEPELSTVNTIVTEVGGGATEVLLVKNGNVHFSHTYRLGSQRIRKSLQSQRTPAAKVREIMETRILQTVQRVVSQVPREGRNVMIGIGGDIRFAAQQLHPDWPADKMPRLPLAWLEQFTQMILEMTEDELVQRYQLSFPDAETVGPALLTYLELARSLGLEEVLVNNANLRDGLLQEMAAGESWNDEFRNQVIRSAVALGRNYAFDEPHAQHVAHLCDQLFHGLTDTHRLARPFDLILHVAAVLHEIGAYVSSRSLHKHSMYLIRNSEVFGLGARQLLLVALVARYHRRASPQSAHEAYSTLSLDERVAVSQLAAILRVAIALDEARQQRIDAFEISWEAGSMVITVPNIDDLSIEQLAMSQHGSLFEEVFGATVLLRSVRR